MKKTLMPVQERLRKVLFPKDVYLVENFEAGGFLREACRPGFERPISKADQNVHGFPSAMLHPNNGTNRFSEGNGVVSG